MLPRQAQGSSSTASNSAAPVEVEIVSEEEMAFIEAALASSNSLVASSRPHSHRTFSASSPGPPLRSCAALLPDVEDSGRPRGVRVRLPTKMISVTDLTRTEWCEKQMEFSIVLGKPETTTAMKAGSHRHAKLEEEVIQRVNISVKSQEDGWAIKFLNFIVGVNQLLFDGLTRELPVIGFLEGVWLSGIIDELRLDLRVSGTNPLLVDTKTRTKATLPSEAQKRNGRLQLMCYKYLWDSLVAGSFLMDVFFEHFNLKPESLLSDEVKEYGVSLGLHLETFNDVVTHFREVSQVLPLSEDLMILRYEFQKDNSLLGEYVFNFDDIWFKAQVQKCIEFLQGAREATYVPDDELFKCNFCSFSSKCLKRLAPKASA